ncbi:MAG: T9SS type A sorting domain-containing protein [Candidatus Eisenbacteria bacterium]|nr:T9SS type A sorting domain-containing protein [Candidatus Eisenbacteria bacterium]
MFGYAVSSAGDANGDGYSDILIGAPRYDGFTYDSGLACLWLGGPGGPVGGNPDECDQGYTTIPPESHMGRAVGYAGDVNGDGYSDILVGGPRHPHPDTGDTVGVAVVWPGCAEMGDSSCDEFPVWAAYGAQDAGGFGTCVASADVNADGFSDILVGAPEHTQGQTEEGRVFLYYGNDSRGLARAPVQMRSDASDPVALLNRSDSENAFGLRALGRTAAGRGRVRLEWEVKPFGVAFDGTSIESGVLYDTGDPDPNAGSAVMLSELVTGLETDSEYHWRLRIAGRNPFFPSTPWFSPAGNGPAELDIRTAGGASGAPEIIAGEDGIRLSSYPNPVLGSAVVQFGLPQAAEVQVGIYDVRGRLVRELIDGVHEAGVHSVSWDGLAGGGHAASGVYWIRLTAGESQLSRQIIVTR